MSCGTRREDVAVTIAPSTDGSPAPSIFDDIYSADLRYRADCWQLCGDAHCCSFARYKSRLRVVARTPFQELPLLPNEFEYLASRGWLEQFGDYQHNVVNVELRAGTMRVETIVSRRVGCACDQATRPTVCRLYPLLPVFDLNGRVIGTESFGVYEVLEELESLEPACRLTSLPFEELEKFHRITAAIGRSPVALFYSMAYRLTKAHVRERVRQAKMKAQADAFLVFARMLMRERLTDQTALVAELDTLAEGFRQRYGAAFALP
jgi:hypothetical protein